MELSIPPVLEAFESDRPDHPMVVHRDREWTRSGFGERTRRFANVLLAHDVRAHGAFGEVPRWESVHDHVALYLHNRPEYLEAMVGAWKARAVPVNVNYRYVADELGHILRDSRAAAVVFERRFGPTLAAALEQASAAPRLLLWIEDGSAAPLLRGASEYETALADADPTLPDDVVRSWTGDDLYICYTGGTTGLPKGATWRQADFLVGALGVRHHERREFTSVDEVVATAGNRLRCLPAPPFMHGAAHWNAISCWFDGGTVVIQGSAHTVDPADLVQTVRDQRVDSLLLVGDPMARPLVDELRAHPSALPTLRHVLSGGAVLSPDTRAALLEVLPGVTVVDVLGSTESGRQGVARVSDPTDAGAPFTPSEGAVVLDAQRRRVLAPGEDEVGWLARSGRVPLGYLGDPDRTASTFPVLAGVRYAVPGDRAQWLADGSVRLLGRDSVCVNTGGEKVFVEEVEQAIRRHPAVADVVVCGRPSDRWGEEVVAVVELRDGHEVSDGQLLARAGETVARYKLPKVVLRVGHVVRSPSGKADYRWAREVATGSTMPDPAQRRGLTP